jgi:hypothetical protein
MDVRRTKRGLSPRTTAAWGEKRATLIATASEKHAAMRTTKIDARHVVVLDVGRKLDGRDDVRYDALARTRSSAGRGTPR